MQRRQRIGRWGGLGDVAAPLWPAERLVVWLLRAKGSFPLGGFPRRVCARSGSASEPVGWCGRPIGRERRRGRAHTRRNGRGKGDEEEIGVYDRWGRLVIGGKEKRERLLGWLGCDC
jgi:hypothetical protein